MRRGQGGLRLYGVGRGAGASILRPGGTEDEEGLLSGAGTHSGVRLGGWRSISKALGVQGGAGEHPDRVLKAFTI